MEGKIAAVAVALSTLLPALSADDATLTLSFEKMHCGECRSALESNLKLLKDVQAISIDKAVATLSVSEGSIPDLPKLRRAIPTDLKLRSVDLDARGTVAASKEGLTFTPRAMTASVTLVNLREDPKPEEDRIAELRKAMSGKNRFRIVGEMREKDGAARLALRSFQATDWKE